MNTTSKSNTVSGLPSQTAITQNSSDIFKTGGNEAGAPKLTEDMTLLTYKAAAEILGTCQKTVENICRVRKEIPIVFVGYMPRIRMSDLRAYIARGGSQPIE